MTSIPPSPEAVGSQLQAWLADRYGDGVSLGAVPKRLQGGFDYWTYALSFEGQVLPEEWTGRLVVRIAPEAHRLGMLERESRYQSWAAEHGFPAPSVVELIPPGAVFSSPVQVMRLVPGVVMAKAITSKVSSAPGLIRTLGSLHAELHRLPIPEVTADPEADLAARRLSLVRQVLEVAEDAGLARGLEQVERILPRLVVAEPVLCHGDFHPMNILVADSGVWVIDWTDAGVGDRHGDVARTAWLFKMAAVGAASGAERAAMKVLGPILARGYLSAYRRQAPLEPDRLRLWEPLQLLHLWALTVADDIELRGPSQAGRTFNRRLGGWARHQFEVVMREVH